jgi:hypothetical protein
MDNEETNPLADLIEARSEHMEELIACVTASEVAAITDQIMQRRL